MIAIVERTPIRIRLTLAFAVVMAVVLGATGLFVYIRLESALDQTLNAGLRSRADDVAALIGQADTGLSEGRPTSLAERGESFAQVIASDDARWLDRAVGSRLGGRVGRVARVFVRAVEESAT